MPHAACSNHDQCQDNTQKLTNAMGQYLCWHGSKQLLTTPRPMTEEHRDAECRGRCSGYEGFTCENTVRGENKKCQMCKSRQLFLDGMGELRNPFLVPSHDGHGPVCEDQERHSEYKRIEALCFDAAEKLAQLLADNGERGFEKLKTKIDTDNLPRSNDNIAQEALDRLAFLGPHRQDFYHGAKCAGSLTGCTRRSLDQLQDAAFDDDYKPYVDVVKRLLKMVAESGPEEQKDNLDWENWESDRTKAWCCRAALASAYVAHAHDAGIEMSWLTLEPGVCAKGDLPTWRPKGSVGGGPPIQKPASTRNLVVKYNPHASPGAGGTTGGRGPDGESGGDRVRCCLGGARGRTGADGMRSPGRAGDVRWSGCGRGAAGAHSHYP